MSSKFFYNSEEFVSLACHYDNNTLLTKNGELVQTILIEGIGLNPIPKNLSQLRSRVRDSLIKNLHTPEISCWIHNTRRRGNLDDDLPYPTAASQYFHDLWVKKNYWHDKYLNKLYISFVYRAKNLEEGGLKSISKIIKIANFIQEHDDYLKQTKEKLDLVVSQVVEDLKDFYPKKLGIYFKDQNAYCSILSLFYGILRGIEREIEISEQDTAKILGNFAYGVGLDQMEIMSEFKRKYLGIISLKEYQEIPALAMEDIIQTPTEFIITEVFYFVDPKEAKNPYSKQIDTARISKDPDLLRSKQINRLVDAESQFQLPYCRHQISIMLLNENLDKLSTNIGMISSELSRLGLINVKEDVRIEPSFWAQIPGNFKFLKRLQPCPVSNIAAFATVHNTTSGFSDIGWGYYITLVRTARGTPYFFNFHSREKKARMLIAGVSNSGKTIISNFMISESLKFKPKILMATFNKDSYVFAKINEIKWIDNPIPIDFFKVDSIRDNKIIIREFLLNMAGASINPLAEDEIEALNSLLEFLFSIKLEERSFDKMEQFDFSSTEAATRLKVRLADYLIGGEYNQYFIDDGRWELEVADMSTIDFSSISDESFNKKHYPNEERYLPEYYKKLKYFLIFREILVSSTLIKFRDASMSRKCIIDNESLTMSISMNFAPEYYQEYFNLFAGPDIVYISEVNFSNSEQMFNSSSWQKIQDAHDTRIYLSAEFITDHWQQKFMLEKDEFKKLQSIIVSSRLFLMKEREGQSDLLELSIGGFGGMIKILSSDSETIEKFSKFFENGKEMSSENIMSFYKTIS